MVTAFRSSARDPLVRHPLVLWALLAVAFSPVLIDLARHLAEEPWALYPLAFAVLLAREAVRAEPASTRPRLAWALLVGGLVLELVMVRADWPRMARPGFVAAAFGLTLLLGRPPPWRATLLLWWIPIPHALLALAHPYGAFALATPAVQAADLLGPSGTLEVLRDGELVARLGSATLALEPADAGIPLAVALGGLGWYAGLACGLAPERALLRALGAGLVALGVQGLLVSGAVATATLGAPGVGRTALDVSVATLTAIGLVWVWWRTEAGKVTPPRSG